jgi:hypothetical protein
MPRVAFANITLPDADYLPLLLNSIKLLCGCVVAFDNITLRPHYNSWGLKCLSQGLTIKYTEQIIVVLAKRIEFCPALSCFGI